MDIMVSIDKHNPEVIADWKDTGHKISTGLGAVGGNSRNLRERTLVRGTI
ncbi:hypothetical protein [Commensalibacter oyaizuii]|uniref:Uncharacterized protein n=1 Tax=Commensalibacter oyaizuii TaxID=3043873 RepID=A0ABT6Q2E8_9PROT|nr:hypothetical protein [Commensalibacter sp. TBRC 16381]MDI2091287.1 hypothetical protein [Commensalibacter sp. TBRC 16381]